MVTKFVVEALIAKDALGELEVVMTVLSVQLVTRVPGAPSQVVCPCKVRAFPEKVTCEDQVQDPEGTITVSPLDAELIAVCTSADEQVAAWIVAA